MEHLVTQSTGEAVTSQGNVGKANDVIEATGALTLTVDDSGKTVILNAAAGAQIDLPAPVAGINYRFVVGQAFATTNWTVVSSTNVIQGYANVNNALVPASNENTISFVATADTVGDHIEIECDGTNYYANGVGLAAGAITFTAP